MQPWTRPWGFSTGALARADFRRGLELIRRLNLPAVELSALRLPELPVLLEAFDELELSAFRHVSLHFPSAYPAQREAALVESLRQVRQGVPVVVHPDAICDFALWRGLGAALLVENMDRRKSQGRTVRELGRIFEQLPDARLCFDVAHARQVDTSLTEAFLILERYGERLAQVHLSEVSTSGRHGRLSRTAILAFQELAPLIPPEVPVILESPVSEDEIEDELMRAEEALSFSSATVAYG
jgi:hypothetical protein